MNTTRVAFMVLAVLSAASIATSERVKVVPLSPGPIAKYEVVARSASLRQQRHGFAPNDNPEAIAKAFAQRQLNVKPGEYKVHSAYRSSSTGITHVYLRQLFQGVEVANGDISVNVNSKGVVIAYSDNFYHGTAAAKRNLWAGQSSHRFVEPGKAFVSLASYIGKPVDAASIKSAPSNSLMGGKSQHVLSGIPYAKDEVVAQQAYIHTADGALEASWEFFVDIGDNYFNAHVAASGEKVIALNDWVSDATYNVVPFDGNDIGVAGRTLVKDPANEKASPKGWHDFNGKATTTTSGNNVEALAPANTRQNTEAAQPVSAELNFDYPVDLAKEPSTYRDAAVTNLFYMSNIMHDIFYQYGFDEAAGNFQNDNYGKGGLGGDHVLAHAQDPSGKNNANFYTPPDGQRPRMRMYTWDKTTPHRDGDFENDIIAHEYTHGISNRLTGGPANSNCLGWGESGGLGEGWGDFHGLWLRLKANDTRSQEFAVGSYVFTKGIRKYAYSTDMKTNPTTYGLVYTEEWAEEHRMGEIWANMLYEMYWSLVDKLGFQEDKYSVDTTKGNTLAAKLVIDGMKLQPCRPTFVSARDAILQAEQEITGGKHQCAIWTAFAKRGLGAKAATDGRAKATEDFSLPENCGEAPAPAPAPAKA
ncbi:Fungalysin metallopeptidase-domain-containing protein [Syncephalis pseudoplumigaleata]|uniref:Extracellular metalloproteinase n=1 Tax=Syncephalis pseudoplumigaleata TaxID=1712513 RepID=A0A4P9Z655_9FUNG|nr:Fungalysin metallopeptidase-domain-containing protein [Syncephalis pseudoplumigaleata]|eukprot:RKP28123.1 Fungalysin metallopeptidase-domain-containing protein [Syncephalis pseudoplumigaleata]